MRIRLAILFIGFTISNFCFSATIPKITENQTKKIKAEVSLGFKDPESAKYRSVERIDAPKSDTPVSDGIFCGEVNAKNSFGAYVGYRYFMASILNGNVFVIGIAEDDRMSIGIAKLCAESKAEAISRK